VRRDSDGSAALNLPFFLRVEGVHPCCFLGIELYQLVGNLTHCDFDPSNVKAFTDLKISRRLENLDITVMNKRRVPLLPGWQQHCVSRRLWLYQSSPVMAQQQRLDGICCH